jgi:hypothetical protein
MTMATTTAARARWAATPARRRDRAARDAGAQAIARPEPHRADPPRDRPVRRSGAPAIRGVRASARGERGRTMRRMYHETFRQMHKLLGQLDKWLEATTAFADSKKIEQATVLGYRLAPDQFAFARQVQVACDTAKVAASRLTGKDAPSHPDTEQTIEELSVRVRAVRAYLDGLSADDFAGAATRVVTQPRWEGKVMTGADYFLEHAVPNFFFHTTHAYAILRHLGVPLGKRDYLGAITLRAP